LPESATFEPLQLDQVCNLGVRKGYVRFCGEMTYSIPFEVAQSDLGDAEQVCLHLGKDFESVEVLANHQNCESAIAPPYVFYVGQYLKVGKMN
jgi:hypothetical protein